MENEPKNLEEALEYIKKRMPSISFVNVSDDFMNDLGTLCIDDMLVKLSDYCVSCGLKVKIRIDLEDSNNKKYWMCVEK